MQDTQQTDANARKSELEACEDRVDAITTRLESIAEARSKLASHIASNERTYANMRQGDIDAGYHRLSLPGLNANLWKMRAADKALAAEQVDLETESRALREAISDLR